MIRYANRSLKVFEQVHCMSNERLVSWKEPQWSMNLYMGMSAMGKSFHLTGQMKETFNI
jgi:hypothetical protein